MQYFFIATEEKDRTECAQEKKNRASPRVRLTVITSLCHVTDVFDLSCRDFLHVSSGQGYLLVDCLAKDFYGFYMLHGRTLRSISTTNSVSIGLIGKNFLANHKFFNFSFFKDFSRVG